MVKEKYLIVGHMCWCRPVVGKGTREAEVVGSNPDNAGKNRTRAYSRKKSHVGKRKYFLDFYSRCKYLF